MLVKIVLIENQNKNGHYDELGAQLSQASCLSPIANILAKKGTTQAVIKGLKALSTSEQRGIEPRAQHESEGIKVLRSLYLGHRPNATRRNSRELTMLGVNPQLPIHPLNTPGRDKNVRIKNKEV
mgnify:CR=1 FL=1